MNLHDDSKHFYIRHSKWVSWAQAFCTDVPVMVSQTSKALRYGDLKRYPAESSEEAVESAAAEDLLLKNYL